jgi:hypothetical protein
LHADIGIEQGGVDHSSRAVGDDARGVDLVGGVVIFGSRHRLVLGNQLPIKRPTH